MAYDSNSGSYDNTNSGLLKKNPNKDREFSPDYKGTININGVNFWLNGWIKTGREGTKLEGQKFFSLSVQPMEDQQGGNNRGGAQYRSNDRGGDRGGNDRGSYRAAPSRNEDRGSQSRGNDRGHSGSGFDDMDDDIPF